MGKGQPPAGSSTVGNDGCSGFGVMGNDGHSGFGVMGNDGHSGFGVMGNRLAANNRLSTTQQVTHSSPTTASRPFLKAYKLSDSQQEKRQGSSSTRIAEEQSGEAVPSQRVQDVDIDIDDSDPDVELDKIVKDVIRRWKVKGAFRGRRRTRDTRRAKLIKEREEETSEERNSLLVSIHTKEYIESDLRH